MPSACGASVLGCGLCISSACVCWICSYSAGDVLMVQPQNVASVVDQFLLLLSLDPAQLVRVEVADPSAPPLLPVLHSPCSLRALATHYLDVMSVPRRSFFELLAHFASSEQEREKLVEFASTEGQVSSLPLTLPCRRVSTSPSPPSRRSTTRTAAGRDARSWRPWQTSLQPWKVCSCPTCWSSSLHSSHVPSPLPPP